MKPLQTNFDPEPDLLIIFSQDNTSYRLALFVQSEYLVSWRTLYYFGAALEVLFNDRTFKIVCLGVSTLVCDSLTWP